MTSNITEFAITTSPDSLTKCTTVVILLIILLCGDIEVNPGPNTIYPCGVCERRVDWSCRAIACDQCHVWFHQSCASMSNSIYDHHVLNESMVWTCHHCGTPNYGGSFTFHSYEFESSNNFSALELKSHNLAMFSPDADFRPKHTSSPSNCHNHLETSTPKSRSNACSLPPDGSTKSNGLDTTLPPKGKNWRSLVVNFNSIRDKQQLLEVSTNYLKPDVIIGCETKITKDIKNTEILPPEYQKNENVFRKDRNEFGGGVILAFREGLVASQIEAPESDAEEVWAQVQIKNQPPLKICSFYRPPGSGPDPIIELNKTTEHINRNGKNHIIVAGDFNCGHIDWKTCSVNPRAPEADAHHHLIDYMNDQSLTNIQHQSTRVHNNLDLYLTSIPSLVKEYDVVPGLSDHDMVVIDSEISPMFSHSKPRKIPLHHKANWEQIKKEANDFASDFSRNHSSLSVNENWLNIKGFLRHTLEENIPSKMKTRKNRLPWLNTALLRNIKKKKRLFRKAKKSKSESDWNNYKIFAKSVKKELRYAHRKHMETTLEKAIEEGNSKPFWGYIKARKKDAGGIAPLKVNGELECTSQGKAEVLSKQFTSVFTKDKGDKLPETCGAPQPTIAPLQINEKGVMKLLEKLKPSKAPGPDGIPNRLLKELAQELAGPLTLLFNQSIKEGEVPKDWKKANIAPIYKKDDKHKASNYRPVSLTCVCSKILEHIVVSHLMTHLEKNKILTNLQHGFRRSRSCTTQLLITTSDLQKHFDKNTQVDMCILDFSKAFDVVSHRKLESKLDHYGIRNNILCWITDFLTDREQTVVVDGSSSEPAPVLSGVPQGTCLGPILFLCYINDIAHHITSQMRLFADDALLYRPIKSIQDQIEMQHDLDLLQNWADAWDMNFNPSKCYVMSSKRHGVKHSKFYRLKGEILQEVNDNPYLGVILSNDMTFTTHINKTCSKSSKTLGLLQRNLRHCPPKLKETAYKSMCRSTLEYASQIWDPHLKKEVEQIERIQRKAARMVSNDYRQHSSVSKMMNDLKWEPLSDRRQAARLSLLYQILHEEIEIPIDRELIQEGRRGRLKHLSHNHQGYKFSYYPRTIRDWNGLPYDIKNSPDLISFKLGLPKRF